MIKEGNNPYFVKELETGYAVLGDNQYFKGYTIFLCKQHASELHELDADFKLKFLKEMSLVGEAVSHAFPCEKNELRATWQRRFPSSLAFIP